MNNDCIFCKIATHTIPALVVYEDEFVMAFLDQNPVNLGHTLVIPKNHYANIYEATDEILGKMMSAVKKVASKQKDVLKADGVNINVNNDKGAGQIIFHSHFHVIPRYEGDGFKHWHGQPHTEEEKNSTYETLKNSLS
jgi:histidine triad (HIT) family protein